MSQQNALAVLSGAKISSLALQSKYATQELGAGIAAPFAVIGYKGSRWSIRHRGVTTVLERFDAQGRRDGFVPFLDVVILFAASHHSKVYYEKNYSDGDDDAPDCWSTNGTVPDQAAPKKQSQTCATCKWNEFGSRVNAQTGSKGKACADTRRMAVVPYADIENTALGGPMLLRVPPASLGAVGEYSDMLKANAAPYSAVATRIGFDPGEAYPKMQFEPIAALSDVEMAKVLRMQEHPLVERIVQEQLESVAAQPAPQTPPPGQPAQPVPPPPPQTQAQPTQQTEDPGPQPAFLRNGRAADPVTPQVTSPVNAFTQAAQAEPPAQPTAQQITEAAQPQEPAQTQEVLTPAELRIRELEAQLAAAKGGEAPKRTRKPRTGPVAPQATAQSVAQTMAGNGAGTPAQEPQQQALPMGGEEDGSGTGAGVQTAGDPALTSLSARLSKIISA